MVNQVEIISLQTNKINDTSMKKGKKKLISQNHPSMEQDLQLWRCTNTCSKHAVGCKQSESLLILQNTTKITTEC